jgi:hypothetical protein
MRLLGVAQDNPRDIDVTLGPGDWIGGEEPATFTPADGPPPLLTRRHRQCRSPEI